MGKLVMVFGRGVGKALRCATLVLLSTGYRGEILGG